jgi:hypothetical protein
LIVFCCGDSVGGSQLSPRLNSHDYEVLLNLKAAEDARKAGKSAGDKLMVRPIGSARGGLSLD